MSADERKDEGAGDEVELAETGPQDTRSDLVPEWVVRAWRMWTGGVRNWSAICREVGHDRETVKKHVCRYSQTLVELLNDKNLNPLAEYLEGLVQDLQAQTGFALTAENTFVTKDGEAVASTDFRTRVTARKEVTNIRKLMADACGVVTERRGVEVSGSLETSPNLSSLSDEDFAKVVELQAELQRLTRGRPETPA